MFRRSSFCYSVAGSALLWSLATLPANAQDAEAEGPVSSVEEVVVTGSRVARSGFDAPTPTTVLSSEEMNRRGTSQVGEFLNEVPAFRATQTPQSNPHSARGAGQFFADLRGLGSTRTLTLVNGRRHVPSSPEGQVDLNLIPSLMVARVDVVTGGASAQWGSDAISGVVNVVLDTNLQGFKSDVSYGVTTYGDNTEKRIALAYGGRYADGRGRFVAGGEFVDAQGVSSHWDRPFGRDQQELVSYSGARPADAPSRFYAHGVTPINFNWGGMVIGPNTGVGQPLRGIRFGPNGEVLPYNYGTTIGTAAIDFTGGEPGLSIRSGHTLVLPVERQVVMAYTDYEVSDKLKVFGEVSYAHAGSDFTTAFTRDSAANAILIQRDNAFLPADMAAIMDANNITSFSMGREHKDFGEVRARNFNTTKRITVGANGALSGGWTWDAYYQYGENEYDSVLGNLKIMQNFRYAYDAVRNGAGQVVCRNAAAQAAGCVPINLFGYGAPSPEAIKYVNGDAKFVVDTSQQVFAVNVQGEPFSTWAGPVSLAAGAEHRTEKSSAVADAISEANGYAYGNPKSFEGEYTVTEGYLEFVAPLITERRFFQNVDLNAAVRYADYSSSGGAWTWKAGVTWDVDSDLRFRVARSRDFRAPNNSELFAETSNFATLRNPFSGATQQIMVANASSPTLKPETADTLTIGAVYSPGFMKGLRLSVDYFNIEIEGAISAYSADIILENCANEINSGGGAGFFCGFVTRSGTGASTAIEHVSAQLMNIAGYQSRGIDFEAAYRFDWAGGKVDARLVGTHMIDLISDDGLGVARTYNASGVIQNVGSIVNRAGQVGGFNSSSISSATSAPEWAWSGSLNYSRDNWSAMIQGRYVGGGLIDATLVGPGDADYDPKSPISIASNRIESRFYVNTSANYQINERVDLYGVVNNVANTQPPFPYTGHVGFYDKIGRSFKVGVRMRF